MQVQILLPLILFMIKIQTKLKVIDNTSVKKALCIKTYKGKTAKIGDKILISVKKIKLKKNKNNTIIKGDLFKAFIVQTKYKNKNFINNYINFDQNSLILLNNQGDPLGTRLLSPIPIKFRQQKHFKIISIASTVL